MIDLDDPIPHADAYEDALGAEYDAIKKLDDLDGRYFFHTPTRFAKRKILELFKQYAPAQKQSLRQAWANRDDHVDRIKTELNHLEEKTTVVHQECIHTPASALHPDFIDYIHSLEQQYHRPLPNPYFQRQYKDRMEYRRTQGLTPSMNI